MRPEAYRLLASREDTYWWHNGRRIMIIGLLRRFGLSTNCRWLDLGCGTGGNLNLLNRFDPAMVVGLDLSVEATTIAAKKAPQAQIVRADLRQSLPFADATFD